MKEKLSRHALSSPQLLPAELLDELLLSSPQFIRFLNQRELSKHLQEPLGPRFMV